MGYVEPSADRAMYVMVLPEEQRSSLRNDPPAGQAAPTVSTCCPHKSVSNPS
jgi:hypothetical protein